MRRVTICLALMVLFISLADVTYAALNVGWQPDLLVYVGQTDTIDLFATLYNDASSTSSFDLSNINGWGLVYSAGSLLYDPDYGPTNPYDIQVNYSYDFSSVILNPGDSLRLQYATLTPLATPVNSGAYSTEMELTFQTQQDDLIETGYKTVEVNVAPEPISSLLFIAGGTLLAGRRYLRRKA